MDDRFRFRAWHKIEKKIYSVIKIDYEYNNLWLEDEVSGKEIMYSKFTDVVLMQCAGIKDCNDRLIYEGDIVLLEDEDGGISRHSVEFCGKEYPAFELEPSLAYEMNSFATIHNLEDYKIKITGNIYEGKK